MGRKHGRRKSGLLVKLLVFSLVAFTAAGIILALRSDNQMERLARLEQRNSGGEGNGGEGKEPNGFFGSSGIDEFPDWIEVAMIDVDGASRRGEELEAVRDIVIHYVGNPGTTARQNRDFFNNPDSDVSAHFVVGLSGEVIQCIPMTEKSSATNERNKDTISVEVCHPDATGAFTESSYESLVRLVSWLCDITGLKEKNVIRHYDVTGKLCPLYYVENEGAWDLFLRDVKDYKKSGAGHEIGSDGKQACFTSSTGISRPVQSRKASAP